MSARNNILQAITANKPALVPLPGIDLAEVIRYDDLLAQYKKVLHSIGGVAIELQNVEDLQTEIAANHAAGRLVVNRIHVPDGSASIDTLAAAELAAVDIAYMKATLAVAENGCVWLYESEMGNRLLPFICQHLVLLVDRKNIVATMHQAYENIDTAREGFGVFIAGPSKTADIEQSLVIGAHGARSLVVYIMN